MTIERDDDPLWKLADWVWQLRREQPLHRVIDIVGERAEQADGDDYRFLALDLARLLREAGRNAEAIRTLDQVSDRYPDDVRPAISKAHIYLSALDQPEQALKWIDIALERARRTGFFRREALGDKARILLKLSRGDELSDVLEEIMSLQMMRGVPDIGRERDFVDRAPPGLIRKNVLERYNEFRPRRPEDGSTDEPPKFEPANDLT
ncbi:tetratricopeptide repeat protein [Bradyrhizobium sp. I71]|uniref:tetratricopeptide repeat protein n=1 Tax=Bradyrhizobium sp. I71 TaxID=2590772 RepID=UPI001EF867A8|nr:tetratricopeptide repeat protein [Bradyrhizobium sp. I71]ULK99342.1 tetratricopeptide repeat protein [Bradyrhizobium sp. I71]